MSEQAKTLGDEALVAAYGRSRDEAALSELLSRHWAPAMRLAHSALRDADAAEDAAQEAFIALIRASSGFDPSRPFGPWFRTLVLNAARTSARSRKRRARKEEKAAERRSTPEEDPMGKSLTGNDVEARLAALPEDTRVPLVLRFYEGCSFDEIATAIGCPRGTASSRVRRGLEQLGTSLAAAGFSVTDAALEAGLASAASTRAPAPTRRAPQPATLEARARKLALRAAAVKAALVALGIAALSLPLAFALGTPADVAPPPPPPVVASGEKVDKGIPDAVPAPQGPGGVVPGSAQARHDASEGGLPREGSSWAAAPAPVGPGYLVTVRDRAGSPVAGARVQNRLLTVNDGSGSVEGLFIVNSDELKRHPGFYEWFTQPPPPTDPSYRTDAQGRVFVPSRNGGRFFAQAGLGFGMGFGDRLTDDEVVPVEITLAPPEPPAAGKGAVIFDLAGKGGSLANEPLFVHVASDPDEKMNCTVFTLASETDGNGAVALHDLPPKRYTISLKPRRGVAASTTVTVEPGRVTRVTMTMDLASGATVEGRVLCSAAKMWSGPTVRIEEERVLDYRRAPVELPVLEADGRFTIRGLAPGVYKVTAEGIVEAGGPRATAEARVVISDPASTQVLPDLAIGAGAVVTGRLVLESGGPYQGEIVIREAGPSPERAQELARCSVATDGTFRVMQIPRGKATLSVGLPHVGHETQRKDAPLGRPHVTEGRWLRRSFDVAGDAEVALGDILVPTSSAKVSGRVLGPDGSPCPEFAVEIVGEATSATTLTDADGHFESALIPGHYVLSAREPSWGPGVDERIRFPVAPGRFVRGQNLGSRWSHWNDVPVDIAANQAHELDLRNALDPAAKTASLAVHLTDAAPGDGPRKALLVVFKGSSLPSLIERAAREGELARLWAVEFQGADAVLEGLEPGPVTVWIWLGAGGQILPISLVREGVSLTPGERTELELGRPDPTTAGRIEGRISTPVGTAHLGVVAVGAGFMVQAAVSSDGTFRIEIPSGSARLLVIAEGLSGFGSPGVEVSVAAGQRVGPVVLDQPRPAEAAPSGR